MQISTNGKWPKGNTSLERQGKVRMSQHNETMHLTEHITKCTSWKTKANNNKIQIKTLILMYKGRHWDVKLL